MKLLLLLPVAILCACQVDDVKTAVNVRMGSDVQITSLAECKADPAVTKGSAGGSTFYFADGEVSFPADGTFSDLALRCFGRA
jgi:hypothetical protein